MKLIVRDKEPGETEEIVEVWLEKVGNYIRVRSKSSETGLEKTEVNLHPSGDIVLIDNSNFRRVK